ncbi:MAG: hypothetical protein Q7T20_08320 [Saprospiraceae bacterium]|nr:hypothetical protein [Saprospiraceae bacterium]
MFRTVVGVFADNYGGTQSLKKLRALRLLKQLRKGLEQKEFLQGYWGIYLEKHPIFAPQNRLMGIAPSLYRSITLSLHK